jgi:hypothetical protein
MGEVRVLYSDPEELRGATEELRNTLEPRLCKRDQDREDGGEPSDIGGSPLTVDLGGPQVSTTTETVRREAEKACTPWYKGSLFRRGAAPPMAEELLSRASGGSLENDYCTKMVTLKAVYLTVWVLRNRTAAYKEEIPEAGWIAELIRSQKLAETMATELMFDVSTRSYINWLSSEKGSQVVIKTSSPKVAPSARQVHQMTCNLLHALAELRWKPWHAGRT